MQPDGGFEPPTFALQVRRSTAELVGLNGDGGLRSRYLSHAKRAIYQLIYIPTNDNISDCKRNCNERHRRESNSRTYNVLD